MLENNNLRICSRLMRREFRFHKMRTYLLILSIALVCAMCTFTFSMGYMLKDSLNYRNELTYGSSSHILYDDMTSYQVKKLSKHKEVKSVVSLSAIGVLKDSVLSYRIVNLAPANPQWAKTAEALPQKGRMPLNDDEIALDEMTLNALNIPKKLGAKVTIRWQSHTKKIESIKTYQLCGWWTSAIGYTESYAWITPKEAKKLCPNQSDSVKAGVTLYQPEDLDSQAALLLKDLGLSNINFTTNLSYNKVQIEQADQLAMPYFSVNIFVILCGILMIYNIMYISTKQNLKFYKLLKSLGMTPKQIQHLTMQQTAFLCLPSIPIGWFIGFLLTLMAGPITIIGMGDENPALFYLRMTPYVESACLTYITTLAACLMPFLHIARLNPAQIDENNSLTLRQKKPRKKIFCSQKRHTISIGRMAYNSIRKDKRHVFLSYIVLFLSLIFLCSAWIQYQSYNEDIYVTSTSTSDYFLADSTAINNQLRYNPRNHSITSDIMKKLQVHPALKEIGVLKSQEIHMKADNEQRAPIIETFEGKDETGQIRKKSLEGNPNWMDSYEKFRKTGEYIGIIVGLDGLALDVAMNTDLPNEGTFDPEKFETGNYVVASGATDSGLITTPPVGSKVTIGGREFTIMVSQPAHNTLITGANSKEAAFNVTYYMPEKVFAELFPRNGIRNVLFNINHKRQNEFESFLTNLLEDTNVDVTLRSDYEKYFKNARFMEVLLDFLIGVVLMLIGTLNFGNFLVSKIVVRKRELTIYESLGMTKGEQQRMILYEGLLYGGSLVIFLIPTVSLGTWQWGQWWINHVNTWCITYKFSLLPLWITLPVLVLLIITLPLICLKFFNRENVAQRLHNF